jgi:pimeloyl-ACP methyl ester carboxylesterase
MELNSARIATNGIHLNVVQSGPKDGPLVLLLHGFPEFWYGWRRQIPALAGAGFRVWAPDQRGYNTSDKPPRVRDYRLDKLADDVAGLVEASGRRRAVITGHDWGGVVAWWVAANYPELVERLIILNVPHPLVMRGLLLTDPRQLLRSWYMFLFQIPGLPEWIARRGNWEGIARGMRKTSRPGTFADADFDMYRGAWSQPGAFTSMLNWYRAMFRYGAPPPRNQRIMPPTLILWGVQDKFIGRKGAELSLQRCDFGELVFYEMATHWLPHEEAAEVSRRMIAFAGGHSRPLAPQGHEADSMPTWPATAERNRPSNSPPSLTE